MRQSRRGIIWQRRFFLEFDHGLDALSGIFQDIAVQNGGVLFQQQHHGGAAELEIALLLSPADGCRAMVVDDLTHQQRAHFHGDDVSEPFGAQDGVFPGVFLVDGEKVIGDGIDGVQPAGDDHIFALFCVECVAVAVVIVHGPPEDQRPAAHITGSQGGILQQRAHGIFRVLQGEAAVFGDGQGGELAVGGADEMLRIHVHRPRLLPDAPGEKVVVAGVFHRLKLAHVDPVAFDEGLDEDAGQLRGQEPSRQPGQSRRGQGLQQQPTCSTAVQGSKQPILAVCTLNQMAVTGFLSHRSLP